MEKEVDRDREARVAFREAQSEFSKPRKNKKNQFGAYADLDEIQDACLPHLHKHGFSIHYGDEVLFNDTGDARFLKVTASVVHDNGVTLTESAYIPFPKTDVFGMASAMTYGKRYSLQNVTGIVADSDDDGKRAQDSNNQAKPNAPAQQKTSPAIPHDPKTGDVKPPSAPAQCSCGAKLSVKDIEYSKGRPAPQCYKCRMEAKNGKPAPKPAPSADEPNDDDYAAIQDLLDRDAM